MSRSSSYSSSQELADLAASFDFVEHSLTDATSRRETIKDNAGRHAVAEMYVDSTGSGQHRILKPLRFPLTFREEPHLVTGSATIRNPDVKNWHDPIGQVGIYAWLRDDDANYIGASIWTRVDIHPIAAGNPGPPPAKVRTRHFMTFSGFAIKDLPTNTVDPQLTPHKVPLLSALQDAINLANGNG